MPVPIEFFSVVVPKQVIEQKYNGGLTKFIADCPNKSYLEDEYLTRVGFMSQEPLNKYCENLISNGFHFDNDSNSSTDFVVVQSYLGKRWKADWLLIDDKDWASYHE
jgi:hypothetical protein